MNTSFQPPHVKYDDEISLVDLAAIFVRRFKTFCLVFFVVMALGIAYLSMSVPKYAYSSLYEVAMVDRETPVKPVETVVGLIREQYIPQQQLSENRDLLQRLPFAVQADASAGNSAITLKSESSEEHAQEIAANHRAILSDVMQLQERSLDAERQRINREIELAEKTIDAIRGESDSAMAVASAYKRISELQSARMALQSGQIYSLAVRSADPVSSGKLVGGVLLLLVALVLGVFAVYAHEFVAKVRHALAAD